MEIRTEFNYPFNNVSKNLELLEDMAREGWILKNKGSFKNTYIKGEPQNLKYFILPKKVLKNENEIVSRLNSSGWKIVENSFSNYVYAIDEAAEGSNIQLTEEEELRIFTNSRKNNLRFAPLYIFILIMPVVFEFFALGNNYNPIYEFFYSLNSNFFLTVARFVITFLLVVMFLKDILSKGKISEDFKNRDAIKKYTFIDSIKGYVIIGTIILLLFVLFSNSKSQKLPDVTSEPYMTLADFGLQYEKYPSNEGEHPNFYNSSKMESNSPFSKYISASESYDNFENKFYYRITTDIFEMKNEKYRDLMLQSLLYKSQSRGVTVVKRNLDGFENVFDDGKNLIFSKENTIWKINYVNTEIEEVDGSLIYNILSEKTVDFNDIINR